MPRTRHRRRATAAEGMPTANEPTSDWIIRNELGWGLPHAALVVVAGLFVAWRAVRFAVTRIVDRPDRS